MYGDLWATALVDLTLLLGKVMDTLGERCLIRGEKVLIQCMSVMKFYGK